MVQLKFNDASKPTTLDVCIKEKDGNNLESESLEKMVGSEKCGVWNTACKYIHLIFTVCLILRLCTLIFTDNIGPAFVGISKHIDFTSAGWNLEPAVNYLLWFSVMVLQMDAFWHAHVCYNVFSGTGDKIIKFGCIGMLFKFCVPQLVLGLLVPQQLSESYLNRRFQSVTVWHLLASYGVLVYHKILKKTNKGRTPIRFDESFEFKCFLSQMICIGLVLLLKYELDVDLIMFCSQFVPFWAVSLCLFLLAPICMMLLKKAKPSPTLNGGSNEIPTIIATSVD